MKVTVVTIQVMGNPLYNAVQERWRDTYEKFKPKHTHDLVIVETGGEPLEYPTFDSDVTRIPYDGGGWDCGIWQFVGRTIDTDLLVCCNSSTYFHREGWLERFVEEVERYGDGLYGSMASFEYFPHIRTPCMVFQPKVIQAYPFEVNSRGDTYGFECLRGRENFTLWTSHRGFQTRLVTWKGCHDLPDFRKPDNIFRRGDQSNILVKDRHVDAYEASTPEGKEKLARLADGL